MKSAQSFRSSRSRRRATRSETVARVRTLTEADRQAALALWQARFFDSDPFCAWYFSERFTPALSAGVFEDGRLLSMALGRPIALCGDAGEIPAVMVAGVATRGGFERQGHMRRAVAHVEALSAAAGASALVLRPVDPAIYLPLGFLPYSAACLAFGTGNAALPLCDPALCDPTRLAACYSEATAGLAVAERRTAADMAARLRDVQSDGGACLVLSDARGVSAYALLESPSGDAVEATARTAADYAALLDALPAGCMALLPPDAPVGARIPHAMAKALSPDAGFDLAGAAMRFVPEEY